MRLRSNIRPLTTLFGIALFSGFLQTAAAQTPTETQFDAGIAAMERGHYATAMRAWLPLANSGIAQAQNNMGHMYEEGFGVAQNYTTALDWYRKAADAGLAEAQQNVGLLYYYGYGVAENAREAVRWFQMAADQDLAAGEYMLALAKQQGKGTALDYAGARTLFLSAARKNYGDAQLMYAFMQQAGEGADSNPFSGYVWGKIAEANGVETAVDVTAISAILLSDEETARAESTIAMCLAEGLNECPE
jgi:TPR repeat protein